MKKYKVWLLRLIPIVIILGLTIGLSEIFYKNLIDSTTDQCWNELNMAQREASDEIGARMNINLTLLELTAGAIFFNANLENEQEVRDYLGEVTNKTIYDRIDIIFPDGSILVQSTGDRLPPTEEIDFTDISESGTYFTNRVNEFLYGKVAVHAISPVKNESGESVAVLCATIYCSTMARLFTSAHYGSDASLFIVDRRDGNLVVDNREGRVDNPGGIYDMNAYDDKESDGKSFITDILEGNSGRLSYTSEKYDMTSYSIYAPIEGTDYSLIMLIQEDIALKELNEIKRTLMWVGVIETGLLLLLAVWVYFIMIRSIENEGRAQKAELELLQKKEAELESQFEEMVDRREFLETMALNLPGGYHRCTTDHSFRVTFASNSFSKVTGYTLDELNERFGGSYFEIVADEDKEYFMSLAPELEENRTIHCSYRMKRKDGSIRWVQDTTQYVERDGEKYYQCALMDITEQIEEIERVRQAAEASSRAKSTFLFNISHDIRTPMNAIIGFSRMISENSDNSALVKETVDKIQQSGNSLMMLINDVLDISRIERGKEEVNLQPMDLYAHGKNLKEMFSSEMEAAGINFVSSCEAPRDYIYCDQLKLARIMMNMLSNAKKFTPRGGTVDCGCEKLSDDGEKCSYRFFVKDTGIGMSEEFMKRAFGQFEREKTSTESGIVGSGLGLAIIKMMVELMGGHVEIKSELGKGTEISAFLTFALADRESESNSHSEENVQKLCGKRVMLVEDNDFNREIAKYVLEGLSITVEEAVNGKEALEKLAKSEDGYFDIILMDIQMPIMDGYTATERIRKLPDAKKAAIPIIAMTANAFDEDRQKCIDIGMNDHIGKPIDIKELVKVLAACN